MASLDTSANAVISLDEIKSVLRSFLDATMNRKGMNSRKLEQILRGDSTYTTNDLQSEPEDWTEENLIWGLIDAVGLNREPGRPADYRTVAGRIQGEAPDFRIVEQEHSLTIIGENKPPNNIEKAEKELLEDYISQKGWPDYGIATDGFEWVVYRAEHGGDTLEFIEVKRVDLRPSLFAIAREQQYLGNTELGELDTDEPLSDFIDAFEPERLNVLLTQEAPLEFRDNRKKDVEAFYELYIELLFGKSEKYKDDYETCLRDDIVSPQEASKRDEDLFAVTLMNRLLFIKFLEEHEILSEGFLQNRVNSYLQNKSQFPGTLYGTIIKPLFYDLLNTAIDQRNPKHRSGAYADVPYLNGGLFRENVENEKEYDVLDRTLPEVITDLIEGHNLELNGRSFDPAILGSVFEKTINHIGEKEGRQKEVGAYYTPNDVTAHVAEETVDPKVKDIIIESFIEESEQTAEGDQYIRSKMESESLSDILRYIEDGVGIYGANPSAVDAAYDEICNLKILDPACGSGHFLTTMMQEVHRVQVSLMRAQNGGTTPSPKERYEAKKKLALESIYGADVDSVAVEIAKLRIWLKIVEGNGWEEKFGRLPNIEVNILSGNSLVGFPVAQSGQMRGDIWDDQLEELKRLRQSYKQNSESTGKEDVLIALDDLTEELREPYLNRLTHTCETTIESAREWNRIVKTVEGPELFPQISSVKAQRDDGDAFTGSQKDRLKNLGFRTYKKSARRDIESWHTEIRSKDKANRSNQDIREQITEYLTDLLNSGFIFVEVEREPLAYDLNRIIGSPLHWTAAFPEVAGCTGEAARFDIIVGNPPYGNLRDDADEVMTSHYLTSGINEISAQFVERQLELLADDGYFGNVTTLRLIYQNGIEEFHNLLRESLDPTNVACFGFRPSRIFDNAQITVSIITGKKRRTNDPESQSQERSEENDKGEIRTSDLILFNKNNRQHRFDNLTYSSTTGLVLRDKIGGQGTSGPILPKVGDSTKKRILEKLKEQSDEVLSDQFSKDVTEIEGEGFPVWRREGVLYWINPMLEELYSAREVQPFYFETELEQKTVFLVLNSSLYYMYWLTYGNQHHHNWTQLRAFPYPDREVMKENETEIKELADDLWARMKGTFSKSREGRGDFFMGSLRSLIDDTDEIVGEIYGLSHEEIGYSKNYLTDLGEGSGRAGDTPKTSGFAD